MTKYKTKNTISKLNKNNKIKFYIILLIHIFFSIRNNIPTLNHLLYKKLTNKFIFNVF